MSQVIEKLQKGGSLTIDGIKYDATPEFINALTTHLRDTAGTDAQTLAGLTNALMNGQELTYNSASNTISGTDGIWSGINEKQNQRRKAGSSNWRKWWEAQFDTDAHRFRNALSAVGSFHYQVPKAEEETPDLSNIYGNQVWYEYDTDENGNKKWLDNSAINVGIAKRLADMTDYLSDVEAGKKKYKLGDWYSQERIDALKGLYGNYDPATWNKVIGEIGERAKSNNLSPEDIAFLKNFNIVNPSTAQAQITPSGLSAQDKQKWTDAGYGDLISILGGKAHLNNDGSISLNDGEEWGWNLGDLAGHNIWFNDDFYNSLYGASGAFDPYKNLTLYDNKLYALNNETLAKILNADSGFNSRMRAGDWTGADDLILTRFTEGAKENPGVLGEDKYAEFLSKNPRYRFSDLTGLAELSDGTALGDNQIIQYVNLDDDSLVGPYQRYNYKYALLNNRGKLERELNESDIRKIENGQVRPTGLNTYKRTVGDNGVYNNRYYEDIVNSKGEPTGFRFYNSIDNPDEDVILHMSDIYAADTENKDIILPRGVAKALMSDTRWLDNVVDSAQKKKNFMKIISALAQSWWRQTDNLWYRNEVRQLRKMGMSETQISQFIQAFNEARKGSRTQRRSDMLVNAPTFQKEGGVLKEQIGGIAGGSKSSTGVTEKKVNAVNKNPKNAAGVLEVGNNNWTDADTADMVALAADLGSLAAAFAPGANVLSAVTGAAGSTSRFYADKQRGTERAGLNYLVNLGMDAATLLPLLGAGAKGAKIVKSVKNALPTIIKAASVYGLGASVVDTAKKIASGQKFTVRDVDMLINAVTAGVGLTKSGGFGKPKQTKAIKDIDIVGNPSIEGTSPIKLSGSELKELADVEAAKKLVLQKAKAQGDTQATLENIAERYNLSNLISKVNAWKPGLAPSNWTRTTSKETLAKFKPEATGAIEPSKSALGRWWRGESGLNQMYNKTLRGENPGEITVRNSRIRVYEPKTVMFNGKQITFTPEEVMQLARNSGDVRGLLQSKLPKGQKENWAQLYHEFLAVKNSTRVDIVDEQVPSWYRARLLNNTWSAPGLKIKVGPIGYRTRIYDTNMNLAIPQMVNGFNSANYQQNKDEQPSGMVMQPLYKKGGKIEKGAGGIKPVLEADPEIQSYLDSQLDFNNKVGDYTKYFNEDGSRKTIGALPTVQSNILSTAPMAPTSTQPSSLATQAQERFEQQAEANRQAHTDTYGTFSAEKWNPDLNVPLNWARSIHAMSESDKQLKNFLNRPRYQASDLLLNAPRYVNTGTGNAYRKQADQLRALKVNTSNALTAGLLQQDANRQALQSELQGDLADSQEYGQYRKELDAFNNNYAMKKYNIAEQNKQLRWQHGIEDVQAKNANIAEKSKFFDQAAYATQDWYNRNYQGLQQLNASKVYNAKLGELDDWYRNERQKINAKNLEGDALTQELALLNSRLALKKQDLNNVGLEYNISPWWRTREDKSYARYIKKGGRVTDGKQSAVTYSRDPYPEMLIQNAKDSTEIVKQLNDAVIKLLLQTKPIHVN